jgi:hypothetical protein
MAATVQIHRHTGVGTTGGGTSQDDITSINTRANAQDAHETADVDNPIQIPAAGTNYSYWVSTRLNVTVTPSGTIDNIRWYSDGSNNFGTGVTCVAGYADEDDVTNDGYRIATGTPGETGDILNETNYDSLIDQGGSTYTSDAFGFTSGSPLSIGGSMDNPATGVLGDFVVYQILVGTSASPGATTQETFTFKYDET